MKILSFRHGHDSSAALVIDGKIIADVSEERFSRIKNDTSFPLKSIEYCLKEGSISSEDLDIIALPSLSIFPSLFTFFKVPASALTKQGERENLSSQKKKIGLFAKARKIVKDEESKYVNPYNGIGIPVLPLYQEPFLLSDKCQIVLVEHHLAHAASAAFTSGLNNQKALIVTMDGSGDNTSVGIWRYENNTIQELKKMDKSSSMGWFYANATEAMGWRHGSDEWKVMGLAPYGRPSPGLLSGYHPVFKDGELKIPHEYGNFGRWNDHGSNHYHGKDSIPLSKIFKTVKPEDFAAEVQRISEEQAFNLIMPWLEKEKTRNLMCAGGFFHNIKLNQKLWYSGKLDFHYVFPNAGDGGLPVGAALFVYHAQTRSAEVKPLGACYFGPEYSNDEIKTILEDRGLDYQYHENIEEVTATYLTKNYVIGWFQGRMETGPRALGARSIIMSPLKASNKDLINSKIKYREKFRPFAPAIPIEKLDEYLEDARPSYYMICSFIVKENKRSSIPAVVHEDSTARPQMVIREHNQRYYDLIEHFGQLTGEHVILNTSFNVKGEPIVCNPREAIKCFYDTGMDVLVLGNYILTKPGVKPPENI